MFKSLILSLGLVTIAGSASAEVTQNAFTTNALVSNALTGNALSTNALVSNASTPAASLSKLLAARSVENGLRVVDVELPAVER